MSDSRLVETIDYEELRATIAERKRLLGWDTPEWTEKMRNKGDKRTPEKHVMLARIRERCDAAGVQPLIAYY